MPDTLELSQALTPVIGCLDELDASIGTVERNERLARLRSIQARIREMVNARREEFYGAYRATLSIDATPEELEAAAESLKKKQMAEEELLLPKIERLKQNVARVSNYLDPELRKLVRCTLNAGIEYVSLYDSLRELALRLATERRTGVAEKLRARPVQGQIDHRSLTREIIARFPKILAALAK